MKDEKAAQAIAEAFKQAEPVTTKGKFNGTVLLTPNTVQWNLKEPGIFMPRYEYAFKPSHNTTDLWTFSWKQAGRNALGQKIWKTYDVGIYQGSLDFPPFCCKCMQPVDHYEVIEVTEYLKDWRRGLTMTIPGMSAEKIRRTTYAWITKRYWYAIPFCSAHSWSHKPIRMLSRTNLKNMELKDRLPLCFLNQEYGRLFGELNNMDGKWMDRSALLNRDVIPWVAFFGGLASFAATSMGGLGIYEILGGFPASETKLMSLPVSLVLLLVGIAGLVVAVRYGLVRFKQRREKNE